MNPQEFSWTEDQQVTVTNPTSDDFTWKVHGKEYMLGAGKTAKMPGFIAWLYVYGQSVKMTQADGVFARWNEEGFRQEYYDKFVAGVDELVQIVAEPEPEITTFDTPVTEELPVGGETFESKFDKASSGRPSKA